ncbi:MAG: tRNA guanosine(34) transglycosylase Tgt [Candidatus Magasanikbacteria bacterium CG11_big_fil_rev_8_21_14_0_20_39_34]|uniref:Queuine tRNA-ribosyltransferase n=1 Tax=Candidatus Magasanikbacteria bacterium CG11_big_fil_rev_8_21_14_0_20_39_34 TaxID=1974653 RepID=A0A2H0N3N9_9BACT|nr:MAG: tRNA guanosine(34) transglycosylase Tgt [Candidatus Magasanikbacteria bacterium CG11_big_fil_rev_8_21_14_0_20_39_34]
MNFFEQTSQSSECLARTGIIHTDHGDIETPIFMPVGTKATVKSLDTQDLHQIDAQIILANTYHLHLQPGADLLDTFGGIHNFMQWDKPVLTDSGGFQVFSLGAQKDAQSNGEKLVKIDEDGVDFRSFIDGSKHRFTPESAIDIQHKIGADIIMAFDECTPDNAEMDYATQAMERTHRWAKRCIDAHKKNLSEKSDLYKKFLFGIIQGGNHRSLRETSTKEICGMDFDGIAIGGESIGYNMDATKNILDWISPLLPKEKPHYTMGVGFSPLDLFDVVERGIDMFDCVAPTRMARNGALYVTPQTFQTEASGNEKNPRRLWIDITNSKYANDHLPIDPLLEESPLQNFSRAYLHHLFKSNELLAYKLSTKHNLFYLLDLMTRMRASIREDRFIKFKHEWGYKS